MRKTLLLFVSLGLASFLTGCGGGGGGNSSPSNPSGAGQVTGNIQVSSGTNLQSATVSVDGTSISAPVSATGAFTLTGVPSGVHTVVVRDNGQSAEAVCVVQTGTATNIGQVPLAGAGQVSGVVTASGAGAPIGGAVVSVAPVVTSLTNGAIAPMRATVTNQNGSYTVDALPAAAYLVTISAQGYTTATLSVTVTAGATSPGDIALTASSTTSTGAVSGTVTSTNADGSVTPLGGVFIVLSPTGATAVPPALPQPPIALSSGSATSGTMVSPGWAPYYAYSASDGTYKITGVPPSTYSAYAMRSGFQGSSQSVTVTAQQSTTVNFSLTLLQVATGTIAGTVTDSTTQKPIVGATISAVLFAPVGVTTSSPVVPMNKLARVALPTTPGSFVLTATTDSNGLYTLTVPVATGAVECWATGYTQQTVSVSVTQGQTVTENISLTPTANNPNTTVTVSGVVSETPSPGANVIALAPGATVYFEAVPNWITSPTGTSSGGSGSTAGAGGTTTTSVAPPIFPGGDTQLTAVTASDGTYSISLPSDTYTMMAASNYGFSSSTTAQIYSNTTENFVITVGSSTIMPLQGAVRAR